MAGTASTYGTTIMVQLYLVIQTNFQQTLVGGDIGKGHRFQPFLFKIDPDRVHNSV
jgi:hypothetical protein